MTESTFTRDLRGRILVVCAIVAVVILGVRLLVMQTLERPKYYQMSEENRLRVVPEAALRGLIYDRTGRVIVENRPAYTISAMPTEIRSVTVIAEALSRVLPLTAEEIAAKINARKRLLYQPIRIARSVDFETVCRVEENADKYPGIIFQLEQAREYPPSGMVAHAIGYTSEVSESELEKFKSQGITVTSEVGREGVEKTYDNYLRGRDGVSYLEVTAEGKILDRLEERDNVPAVPGMDVTLTLDIDLQQYVDSLFADSLSGALVALDPNDGGILAFVSKPAYDANMFTNFITPQEWRDLTSDPRKPLLNRIIKAEYPPGSTIKVLVAGAGLEEGVIDRETHFGACHGGYRFGNRVFKCWKPEGHGALGVVAAIAQSCDVYFYQLGSRLGLARFSEYARKCGFGKITGIDIPGELNGLVPDKEWYDKQRGPRNWTPTVAVNLAIGQGELLVTPLQLANFYAAIGNGGILYKPHLLKSAASFTDTVQVDKEVIGHLPFSPQTLAILKEACVSVVYGGGTAGRSRIDGIQFGGKTGTAQNPHGKEHALFCAFAPANYPVIAVAALVENAGHGSEAAAPVVSKAIRRYLENVGILERPEPPPPPTDSLQRPDSLVAEVR